MKRLVVQQNDTFGWDVREAETGAELLYSSDRIRAEGFARQYCASRGGTVTVVGSNGVTLTEYQVRAWARTAYADPAPPRRFGGRRG